MCVRESNQQPSAWLPSLNSSVPRSHSPARQAIVSIHFSSCPAPSSPWWLAWQGRMDWHICTATGPDPFLRPFSWDPSISKTLLDQFWSIKPCSETWRAEMTGGQSVPGLLSRPTAGDLNSCQLGRSVGPCNVHQTSRMNTWATESAGHHVSAVFFITHGLWCNHHVRVLLTCQSHKSASVAWRNMRWKNWVLLHQNNKKETKNKTYNAI